MSVRNSCGFLAREAYRQGRTPTTPTTAAVIAGIEVQEAVKLLHSEADLPNLVGKGFYFDGNTYDCFTIDYVHRDDCLSHETFGNIVNSDLRSDLASLEDVLALAREALGGDPVIELPCEMVTDVHCNHCGETRPLNRLITKVTGADAACLSCGNEMVPEVVSECARGSDFGRMPLAQLGFGVLEIITARSGEDEVQIEISRDSETVFGGIVE